MPSHAQEVSSVAVNDSLWALEQLGDEADQGIVATAGTTLHVRGPSSGRPNKLRTSYSIRAKPHLRDARTHLDMLWQPAAWVDAKVSIVRQDNEPLRFRPRDRWLGGEHAMAYIHIRRRGAHLLLGDFRLRTAASVSDFTSRNMARSRRYPARSGLSPVDIRSYAGASEGPAPRGVAARLPLGQGIRLLVFASRKREDGPGTLRRTRMVVAQGAGLRSTGVHHDISLSWSRFLLTDARIAWYETGITLHPAGMPVKAGLAVAVRDAKRAHIRMADITWSWPSASITLWRYHIPRQDVSPWGPGSRFNDRVQDQVDWGVSIRGRVSERAWLSSGAARRSVSGRTSSQAPLFRSDIYARMDHPRFSVEWRAAMDDEDRLAATPPLPRIRITESSPRHRTTLTLRGLGLARWDWSLRALAASSRALSAQLSRQTRQGVLVFTRAMTWGRTPEAWAVIYTDRIPGHMGLLRASRPRTLQMIRFEKRTPTGQRWEVAATIETNMDEGTRDITWALAWTR